MRHAPRGQWWTTRAAVLCSALAVLLAALVVCLGSSAHADGSEHVSVLAGVADTGMPTVHHLVPADCPPGGGCCAPAVHEARVFLAASSHPLPALLPRMPDHSKPTDTPAFQAHAPPSTAAPDLHVLQVQRT